MLFYGVWAPLDERKMASVGKLQKHQLWILFSFSVSSDEIWWLMNMTSPSLERVTLNNVKLSIHSSRHGCSFVWTQLLRRKKKKKTVLVLCIRGTISTIHGKKQLRHSPFVERVSFSISNFHISTRSFTWQCPRSVFQHWKGGEGVWLSTKKRC